MYYSEEIVEEVRARNDIVEVVSGYVRLQKKGSRYWGLCPFHNEKSASFSVNGDIQVFHCFGCGAGGNVYTFVMNYENYSFPEAVKMLAERAGVALPEESGSEGARQRENRRARLLEVNKAAAKFFYYQLRSPHGEIGYRYLKKRELSDETMHRFGLGFAGKNGAYLVQYLREKGFEDELIQEAGLASHSEKYGLNSQFWNRVMYPIQDINNRVIGFGGRVMGDGEPKYLNSPETPVFDKRRNLYGLNYARKARSGSIILCEGYMDVIAMHQAGFTQAVASLGTAFTAEQAALLRRYTETVLLAYDSDGAGVKAALRAIGILREAGLTGKVINMQPYKDPDEFMKGLGREAFEERIRQAENSFFFEVRILQGQFDMDDPEEKTRFHREIAKKLCEFSEDVERDNYLQAVAEKYYIGIDNLRRLVSSYARGTGLAKPIDRPKSGIQKKKGPEEGARQSQRLLITWISAEPGLYGRIKKYISAEDFTVEIYRRVAERLFSELEEGRANPAGIISMFEDGEEQKEAAALFSAILPQLDSKQEREKAFQEILLSVKKNSYEHYISHMGADMGALAKAIEGKKALEELAGTHISLD
ncbi:MAG: DNA primase [Lachnospiraceae bacterium]|nr:DNA primase [uncultured Acetatifactor sp.]MCI9230931.1 DNA primase [Lachnospiraceae bacterium]MCI9571994.1 DNA primase [Lachnospiraceae bacterium]